MIHSLSFTTKSFRDRSIKYISNTLKKVNFGYCNPLQLEEASKGIALIPNLRFITFSFSSFFNVWDHAIPLDSSFGGFYCFSCFWSTISNHTITDKHCSWLTNCILHTKDSHTVHV
ncbi:hypothetical protein V8G54_034831 [Vigna mungo]|uniref:Uncharacterized protein n=1 Tax=Vigna mungo TaxID=3915 RepID=A0AAQ3MDV2_VIGMU